MTEITEILEDIGLSQSEVKAYLACLKLGSSTAGEIAKEASLNRSNCYEAVKRLLEKGFVSYVIKANKKYFEASSPRHIIDLFKEKNQRLERILPEIEALKSFKRIQEANIYEGYKGLRSLFEEVLKELKNKEEFLVFNAVEVPDFFKGYFENWNKRRIKKGIKQKLAFNENVHKEWIDENRKVNLMEIRVVPKEMASPAVINIWKDKVAILIWTKEPIGFVIKNKENADAFKKYFKVLWNFCKK